MDKVVEAIEARARIKKDFSIIAVAEGAMTKEEAGMKKKDRVNPNPYMTVGHRIAADLQERTGLECRAVVPGHIQRGGSPSPYDRVLATRLGVRAAELIRDGKYGVTVGVSGQEIVDNPLDEVAGKTKFVPVDHQLVRCPQHRHVLGDWADHLRGIRTELKRLAAGRFAVWGPPDLCPRPLALLFAAQTLLLPSLPCAQGGTQRSPPDT